jgi:hypothetical protein
MHLEHAIVAYQSVLQGPHVPIKEATWEFLLSQAAQKAGVVSDWTPSSHKPGSDIDIDGQSYSCKTSRVDIHPKTEKECEHVMISSYRLTNKCNGDTCDSFVTEIDNKRCDFEHYALLVRTSVKTPKTGEHIHKYRVYRIPAAKLKAQNLQWKKEKNGNWVGIGEDYSMTIQKSMSYQLWIKVPLKYIQNDMVLEIDVKNRIRAYNLSDLYNLIYASSTSAPPVDLFANLSLASTT